MNQSSYIVVGDDYATLSNNNEVLTANEFLIKMETESSSLVDLIVIGQGISNEQRKALQGASAKRGIICINETALAPVHLTHKRSSENVLIGSPRAVSAHRYEYDLILDNSSDRLSDHVTGQHVGAMILMEAARQAVIATLESEFPGSNEISWGYILESFNTEYKTYAFPLPTQIYVSANELSRKEGKQISVELPITIHQGASEIACMSMKVTLSNKQFLHTIEQRKAKSAIASVLSEASLLRAALAQAIA